MKFIFAFSLISSAILGFAVSATAIADTVTTESLLDLSFEELLNTRIQVGSRTGSNLLGDFAANITVITADDLRHTGFGELPKALNVLLPSFTYAFSTLDDLTDHARPFSLNGLKGDQVLVLINGKRVHRSAVMDVVDSQMRGSASVDLNLIPIESIQRIEVLNDDASAQYGSDAIAGVINIVLKQSSVREAVLLTGQRSEGDGKLYSAAFNIGNGSHFSSLEIKQKDYSNTSGLDRRDYYFPGDPRNGDYQITHRYGDPEQKSLALTCDGNFGPDERTGFYYVGKLVYKESESAGFFRRPNDDRTVRSIDPNGYLPLLAPIQYDVFGTAGYRGSLDRYGFDLSNTVGFNRIDIKVKDSVNASLGDASPTSFDAGSITFWQDSVNADFTTSRNLGLATPMQIAFGAEGRFEEYRIGAGDNSSWIDGRTPVLDGPDAGASTTAGAQLYPGFTPQNANKLSRSVGALYVEAEQKFLEHFDSRLAVRNEYYSDFGNTLNGKALFNYKPMDQLVFRASAATGFKAPSLQQMGYYRTSVLVNTQTSQITQSGNFPVDNAIAQLLGAKALKPETSRRIGLGVSYLPTTSFELSLDWFSIAIKDRIALSGDIVNSAQLPQAAQDYMNAQGISSASYFLNAVDTTTRGALLAAKYNTNIGRGKLTFDWEYQHTNTQIDAIHIPQQVAYNSDVIFGRSEQERLTNYLPHDKAIFSIKYQTGPLGVTTRANYFGKVLYVEDGADPSTDQWFHAKTTFDLDINYKLTEQTVLAVGGSNIFNTLPDYRNSEPPFNGRGNTLQFRGISPFDYTGAFFYARAVFSF